MRFDNHKHQLLQVPQARLYEEIIKLFMSGHALHSYIMLQKHGIFDLIFPHVKNSADSFDDFYKKAFAQTDDRVKIGKKLNIGFLYATLLWPAIFIKSNIGQKINYKKFYQIIASSIRKQQTITSIPRRFTSFIKDTWMHQIRFDRVGKKSISFTQNIRFRAAYDFYLLRETLEPSLSQKIKWWTEFKAANYDKKVRLINSFKKYGKNRIPKYIAIEGPIGVGKTSLAKQISQEFGHELCLEKPDENPFFKLFFMKNTQKYAFCYSNAFCHAKIAANKYVFF